MRQRKNNSNYGESASRTLAQMYRRIRWGNLVNVFKAIKAWQPKAYDSKTASQTDYNIFVSLNVNSATIGSTKAMNQAGAAVFEAYQVSRGSLPPIANGLSSGNSQFITDIKLSITITASTTVGQLAADIIANNPQFVAGDNIALVLFRNWTPEGGKFPYASSVYSEITLDTSSTALLTSVPSVGSRIVKTSDNVLGVSTTSAAVTDSAHEVGFVAIHTRRSASSLLVSSQSIVMLDSSLVSQYSGAEWDLFCIESYGTSEDAPLEPSFKRATVSSITANGSPISEGASLFDQQVVRVYGENLYAPNFRFLADGVEYTPLSSGDGWVEFILTAAGSFSVVVNGSEYIHFRVEGVYPPSELAGNVSCSQAPSTEYDPNRINIRRTSDYCLNYPFKASSSLPFYYLVVNWDNEDGLLQDDFEFTNCAAESFVNSTANGWVTMNLSVSDSSLPAYVDYKGFIVFVGNYS